MTPLYNNYISLITLTPILLLKFILGLINHIIKFYKIWQIIIIIRCAQLPKKVL